MTEYLGNLRKKSTCSLCLRFVLYISESNLMGKFTQSVRRIVQDVRDEGAPSKFTSYCSQLLQKYLS